MSRGRRMAENGVGSATAELLDVSCYLAVSAQRIGVTSVTRMLPQPNRLLLLLLGRNARFWFPRARRRMLEPEVFAQRLAGIVLVEEPAPLQLRHHMLDEVGVGARHMGRGDDETVARAADEKLLQLICDLLWPADDRVEGPGAIGMCDKVARRRIGLAGG